MNHQFWCTAKIWIERKHVSTVKQRKKICILWNLIHLLRQIKWEMINVGYFFRWYYPVFHGTKFFTAFWTALPRSPTTLRTTASFCVSWTRPTTQRSPSTARSFTSPGEREPPQAPTSPSSSRTISVFHRFQTMWENK